MLLLRTAERAAGHRLIAVHPERQDRRLSNDCFQVSNSSSLTSCLRDAGSPLSRLTNRCCRPVAAVQTLSICVCCSSESQSSVRRYHTLRKSIYCWVACTVTRPCSSKRCSTLASLNTSLNSFGERVPCLARQMRRHASTKLSMATPKCFR